MVTFPIQSRRCCLRNTRWCTAQAAFFEREGVVHSGYGFDSMAERRPCPFNMDPWAKARGPREPKIFQRVHLLTFVSSSSIHKKTVKNLILLVRPQIHKKTVKNLIC